MLSENEGDGTMTFTPIFIPMRLSQSEDHCPSCGKVESIKEVCRHCGHEYEESSSALGTVMFTFLILFVIFGGAWAFITTLEWIIGDTNSLTEVLRSQYEWLSKKGL
jgi:predicted RNA-binding Zn-ribbon protein involved in translation (DUF1610 family)